VRFSVYGHAIFAQNYVYTSILPLKASSPSIRKYSKRYKNKNEQC